MPTIYRDLHYVDLGGKPQKWGRYSEEAIATAIENLGDDHQGLFTTIQIYESPKQGDNEPYDCDFVVDFDGEDALDHCRRLVNYYMSDLKIKPLIYFSGNKGFHVITARQNWGVLTSPDLNKQWNALAWKLKKELHLVTLDMTLYAKRKMLRVVNSKHHTSKLYKIPLRTEELALPIDKIKELAKDKRQLDQTIDKAVSIKAKQFFDLALSFMEEREPQETHESKDIKFSNPPPCIEAILREGVFESHTINNVMFRLVAYFKSQGIELLDCTKLIVEWLQNIKPEYCSDLTSDGQVDMKVLEGQAKATIRSIYNNPNAGFSCGGIKSVIGDRFCTETCRKVIDEKIYVNLFSATKAEYLGKRIYCRVEAIGRQDQVYAIPNEVIVQCEPTGADKCQFCPLISNPEGYRLTIGARTKNILDFIEYSQHQMQSKIMSALPGLPSYQSCKAWHHRVVTHQNVEAIYVAPIVANEFSIEGEEDDRYIREKVYYIGHGLKPNTSYEFTGFTHVAKDNTIKFVFDSSEPLDDTLTNFHQTPEMMEQAKIFCPYPGQTLEEKHDQIVASIAYNHTHVWGREMLLKAIDLVYHSVRKFYFQRDMINGWLDILCIGDTGQGKTRIIESLMKHYRLGIRVTGEAASRTGLSYTLPVNEKETRYIIWGVIPRHTGRLVVIDEFSKLIDNKEFADFTDIRSKGELDVQKSAFGRAKTETRLIWIANPNGRKTMRHYGYPVIAITDLIPDAADIRRFTYAVGVSSNQVKDEVINQNIDNITPIADLYNSDICQNHLLWVWNLKPENIIISSKIEKMILALSLHMCREYVATVQLVEPGDFRLKLARVACAIAARMNLRDGNKLIVTEESVAYAYKFLNDIYKDDSMKYYQYSVVHAENAMSEGDIVGLVGAFKNQWACWESLGKLMMINPHIKVKELAVLLHIEDKELKDILTWMAGYGLLESGRGVYYKSQLGIKFLETLVPDSKTSPIKSAAEVLADCNLEEDDW